MDIFRMKCFVQVANQLNITRAAEVMGITQPAMSVQMRRLEEELGVSLLERDKGRLRLTDAGTIIRDGFTGILSLYDSITTAATKANQGGYGQLKTGFHGALTAYSPLYQGFRNAFPKMNVSVRVDEWLQLTNMVLSGELDVAFIERHEVELRPELAYRKFFTEEFFCVAVNANHPLAKKPSVSVPELCNEDILMSSYKSASIDSMKRQLLSNGFRREKIRLVEDVDGAIAMAASGMGISTMPRFLAIPGNPEIVWVPVSGLDFECTIVMAWRKDNPNPYIGDFVDYCSRPEVIEGLRSTWIQLDG